MKCPQCGLENLEHVKLCVKCTHQLGVISLPEDFSPAAPRAGRSKNLKIFYWKLRRSRQAMLPEDGYKAKISVWKRPFSKLFTPGELVDGSLLAMALSFLMPGAGQFFLKRWRRGTVFITPSLLALAIFALTLYSYSVDTLRASSNIYIIVQSIAVFDAMPRVLATRVLDWFINVFLAGLVWFGCFICVNSATLSITNYFWAGTELRTLMYNYPDHCVIQRNDTILIKHDSSYSRGNIILYTCPAPYLYGNRLGWNNGYIGIDKVIGLPGETIRVRQGIVSVNSVKLDNQPKLTLLPCKIPDMQWTLEYNEYFIITSNIQPVLLKHLPKNRNASVLNINNITGHLSRIVSPFYRRGNL